MTDLGPVRRSNQNGAIQGDNGAQNAATPAGSNNNSSNTMASLEAERARIRTELPDEETALDNARTQVANSSTVIDNEADAHSESRVAELGSMNEYDDATAEAEVLNSKADQKEFEAEHGESTQEAKIRLQFEADELRQQAEEQQLIATEAEANAEESNQEAAKHLANQQVAEQNLGNASAQVTTHSTNTTNLKASSATLSGQSSGTSSGSTGTSGSTLGSTSSSGSTGTSGSTLGSTSSSGSTLSGTSGQTVGGSAFSTYIQSGPVGAYLQAAVSLLGAIVQNSRNNSGPNNANPVVQIAKNLTNKGFAEQATMYLEAAAVYAATAGAPINSQIIFRKAQANTVHGEAETNIAAWKEALNDNKSLLKQTQDLAKMA